MPLLGIDVSHHNPPSADPTDVDFAAVRVCYGTTADDAAEAHLARLDAVRVRLGYTYLETGPHAAPGEAQARFFLDRILALERGHGPLGLAVDTEPLPGRPLDPPLRVREQLLAFCATVAATQRPCAIYGSRVWLADLKLPWWVPLDFPLWAASVAPWPDPWTAAAIRQVGVRGVDRDETELATDELRALFGLTAAPPTGCALPGPV